MVIIICILFIVSLLLIMPIGIKISKIDQFKVNIIFYKFFNKTVDVEKFLKFFFNIKDKKITLGLIRKNVTLLIKTKKIYKTLFYFSKVKRMTIIYQDNYDNIFRSITFWMFASWLSDFIKIHFLTVEDEYYQVSPNKTTFDVTIEIRLIFIIISLIMRIKDVFKALKVRRTNE